MNKETKLVVEETKLVVECSAHFIDAENEYSLLGHIAKEINQLNSDVEVTQIVTSTCKTFALIITRAFNEIAIKKGENK
jgi:hypothetical protein